MRRALVVSGPANQRGWAHGYDAAGNVERKAKRRNLAKRRAR